MLELTKTASASQVPGIFFKIHHSPNYAYKIRKEKARKPVFSFEYNAITKSF